MSESVEAAERRWHTDPPKRHSTDRMERIEWQLNQIRANTLVAGLVLGLQGVGVVIALFVAILNGS